MQFQFVIFVDMALIFLICCEQLIFARTLLNFLPQIWILWENQMKAL